MIPFWHSNTVVFHHHLSVEADIKTAHVAMFEIDRSDFLFVTYFYVIQGDNHTKLWKIMVIHSLFCHM